MNALNARNFIFSLQEGLALLGDTIPADIADLLTRLDTAVWNEADAREVTVNDSYEERFAPFGPEWEREQIEKGNLA